MKILMINDSIKESGGAETHMFSLVRELRKKNDVYIFSFSDYNLKEENKLVLKNKKGFGRFFFSYRIYKNLINYIKEINPDIIHIHNNYNYSVSVLLAIKKFNIPIIQTVHDWGLFCPTSWSVIKHNLKECKGVEGIKLKCLLNRCIIPQHFLVTYFRNKLRFKLIKNINLFISPSKKLKDYLDSFGFKNSIYLSHFKEFNPKINENKENIILYVGVLTKNKGVEYLIKAMEEINNAKLIIVGDGEERKNLEKLNIQNVEFTGKIPHEKVVDYFNKAKLLIIPSVWMENSPMVIYEAMSFGLPIIGSNRGGISDLVKNNETGFIVEPANSKAIAEKIKILLGNEDLRKQFGKKGKESVQKLTPKLYLKELTKIYSSFF